MKKSPAVYIIIAVTLLLGFFTYQAIAKPGLGRSGAPGGLSKAHYRLDGKVNNCTSCHDAWKKVDSAKCVRCHDTKYFKKGKPSPIKGFHLQLDLKKQDCQACHSEHKGYKGKITKNAILVHQVLDDSKLRSCESCHSTEIKKHLKSNKDNLYNGQCFQCHSTQSWRPSNFSHNLLTETQKQKCVECHLKEAEKNHFSVKEKDYGVKCFECHTVKAWKPAGYNLPAVFSKPGTECLVCHANKLSPQHLVPQRNDCASCHNYAQWQLVQLQHTGRMTNCQSCHKQPETRTHLELNQGSQCSSCHTPTTWQMVSFKHDLIKDTQKNNCISCHQEKAKIHPANYNQNCTLCHNTQSWNRNGNPVHNSSYLASCQLCHKAPSYGIHPKVNLNCQSCHQANSWKPTAVDHNLINNPSVNTCYSCHKNDYQRHDKSYLSTVGQNCQTCHNTQSWQSSSFSHEQPDLQPCKNCHVPPDVSYHRPLASNCKACHNTKSWAPALFNHDIYYPLPKDHTLKCISCHPN